MKNKIKVDLIINKPIDSNCYLIHLGDNSNCIIIDPGTEDCEDLISIIDKRNLKPEYIFLTHEHFDHIWGVNTLKQKYSIKVVCSQECAERIIDKKRNLSLFYNQKGFYLNVADIFFHERLFYMIWQGINIEFIKTKGHSEGSICIKIENNLFSGDSMIKGEKTVLKLPESNKEKLIRSLNYLKSNYLDTKIYPGHGSSFYFKNYNINESL